MGCHSLLQRISPAQGLRLCPALTGRFFTTEPPGKLLQILRHQNNYFFPFQCFTEVQLTYKIILLAGIPQIQHLHTLEIDHHNKSSDHMETICHYMKLLQYQLYSLCDTLPH